MVKREDNAGVGKRKTRYAWDEKWWEGTYANAASKIARVVGGEEDGKTTSSTSTSGRDGDSSESEDSSEDEVAARLGTATGRDGVAFSGPHVSPISHDQYQYFLQDFLNQNYFLNFLLFLQI